MSIDTHANMGFQTIHIVMNMSRDIGHRVGWNIENTMSLSKRHSCRVISFNTPVTQFFSFDSIMVWKM